MVGSWVDDIRLSHGKMILKGFDVFALELVYKNEQ